MNAGPGGLPLTGRPVFINTSRSNRCGISVASGSPNSPPQSWHTSVMRFKSSCSMNAASAS